MTTTEPEAAELRLYTVADAMELLRLSRSVLYEQMAQGRLRSVNQGRARRIPGRAISEYIRLLEREAAA